MITKKQNKTCGSNEFHPRCGCPPAPALWGGMCATRPVSRGGSQGWLFQVGLEDDQHNRYQSTCPVCRSKVGYVFYGQQEENGLVRKMNRSGMPTGRRVSQFPRRRRQRFENVVWFEKLNQKSFLVFIVLKIQ